MKFAQTEKEKKNKKRLKTSDKKTLMQERVKQRECSPFFREKIGGENR